MITYEWLYMLAGGLFGIWALLNARDGHWPNAIFWLLLAASFLLGSRIGDLANGAIVLALGAIAATGRLRSSTAPTTGSEERDRSAQRLGNRLFLLALVVPITAVAGTLLYIWTPLKQSGLLEAKHETLILFVTGTVLALVLAAVLLRPGLTEPAQEGRRLIDAIGWAAILPQALAALGAVFALAGVGDIVGSLTTRIIPEGNLLVAVIVFAGGMALFTIVMGNAFAAFPVMATAIGVPVLIRQYGGDPAVIGAVGMLAGFCGTLLSPMAANFNIVPVALLQLKDQNAVIWRQAGTAIPLWICNVAILYIGGFLLWR